MNYEGADRHGTYFAVPIVLSEGSADRDRIEYQAVASVDVWPLALLLSV